MNAPPPATTSATIATPIHTATRDEEVWLSAARPGWRMAGSPGRWKKQRAWRRPGRRFAPAIADRDELDGEAFEIRLAAFGLARVAAGGVERFPVRRRNQRQIAAEFVAQGTEPRAEAFLVRVVSRDTGQPGPARVFDQCLLDRGGFARSSM